jgi:putative ABC transport system permease protein
MGTWVVRQALPMLRVSLRDLLAHRVRFVLTTLAVVLGVGFVVGSFVVTDTLRSSVQSLFEDITSGTDVSVRAESELGVTSATRNRLPEDLVPEVRAVDGVAYAEGSISGYAQMLDADGEPLTTTGAPFIGTSWTENESLSPATLDRGRAPRGPDEVAIDSGSADAAGLDVGDRSTVLLVDGDREVEVVGVFTFGESNSLLGARITSFGLDAAQEALGAVGEFDTVEVDAEEGTDPQELADRIQATLPDGVEAVTSDAVSQEGADEVEGLLSVFQNALLAFAGIALFVSAFLINNTFAIVLAQRGRELALLRALGASRTQVAMSVLLQAVVVGLLASAVGVLAGMVIALGIQQLLSAGGFDLPTSGLVLSGRTWVAAGVVGVGVTVIASLAPARRAGSAPPIEGMQAGYTAPQTSKTRRVLAGAGLTAAGCALLAWGLFGIEETGLTFLALGAGALTVLAGAGLLSPLIAVPFVGALGAPFMLLGPPGRMARANAARTPDRTARTAAALMIGLALVTMVSVVGASIKTSFARTIESAVAADLIVSNPSFTGFSPELSREMAELPELDAVTGVRFDQVLIEGERRELTAVDPIAASRLVDVDLVEGSFEQLGASAIMLHEDPAADLGVSAGDEVTVEMAAGGPQELTVAGVYADATLAGNYLVGLDAFQEGYPANDVDQIVFAGVDPDADPVTAREAVEQLLEAYPQLTLEDRSEYQATQEDQLDQLLVAVNGLLALALIIALLGIANTLALSVAERTREIGLLRAVGMMQAQVRRMVLLESTIIGLFGALLGVVLGVGFGVVAASAIPESLISTVTVPVGSVVLVVILAAVCAVVAGVLPARRAARLEILESIQHG